MIQIDYTKYNLQYAHSIRGYILTYDTGTKVLAKVMPDTTYSMANRIGKDYVTKELMKENTL